MNPTLRRLVSVALILLLLAGVIWINVRVGSEVGISFLYFLPIVAATWAFGLRGGLFLAVLSTLARFWIGRATISQFSHSWLFWERGASGFVTFALVVFTLHTFRSGRKVDRERIRQLEAVLHACPACSRLRQPDGSWKNIGTCLRELPEIPPEKRLCPECAAVHEYRDYPL